MTATTYTLLITIEHHDSRPPTPRHLALQIQQGLEEIAAVDALMGDHLYAPITPDAPATRIKAAHSNFRMTSSK